MLQQMTSAQVAVQQNSAMQVGGDLFDALDTNHDGVIDRTEFNRAMHGAQGARVCQGGGSASMVAGGSFLMQQQQQQQQAGWFESRSMYEGASAAMSVGGAACMSPGASVSMVPAGASVSMMPTLSYVAPVTTTVVPAARMITTAATLNSPHKKRSLTPPASFGRLSLGGAVRTPRHPTPAWL